MVDDTYNCCISSFGSIDNFYSKLCGSAICLYFILKMKKMFRKINNLIRYGINIFVKFLLGIAYFVIFLPFCIFIRLLTDFLDIKKPDNPHWISRAEIKDVERFLRQQ